MTHAPTVPAPTPTPITPPAGPDAAIDGLIRLRDWAAAAGSASQLVAPLVDTPFVPDSYRPKVDPRATDEQKAAARQVAVASATAAVLQGISLGLNPLVSLQQIYVVHGRPGMYAKIKVALVQSHGHEVWTEDNSDSRAVVAGRRRGSQQIERITITMDQARKAGWTKNDTYAKTPADMLWARAAGRVCDRIASDVLMGIPSVEEIDDDTAADQPAPRSRTVQRAATPAALSAPQPAARPATPTLAPQAATAPPAAGPAPTAPIGGDDDEYAAAMAQPTPGPQPTQLDERTWRRINARFVELEVTGDGQTAARLAVISRIVDRQVTRGGELTSAEGATVLDNLTGESGQRLVAYVLGRDEQVADDAGKTTEAVEDPAAVDQSSPDVTVEDPPTEPEGWQQ